MVLLKHYMYFVCELQCDFMYKIQQIRHLLKVVVFSRHYTQKKYS